MLEWLGKINEFAKVLGWDDTDKVFFAAIKLRGITRKWYDRLKSSPMTWSKFSEAIIQQFLGEENFRKLLVAALCKSTAGLSLQIYCFEKIIKLKNPN